MYNRRLKISRESYGYIMELFADDLEAIKEGRDALKETGGYNELHVRLGWEALRYVLHRDDNPRYITQQLYGKEGLNDDHINSALKALLTEVGVI